MARRQSRRSISVKGLTYERLKRHVAETGDSVSGYLEALIEEKLGPPTDEDLRKFAQAQEESEKDSKAKKKAEEKPDALKNYIPPIFSL